MTLPLYLRDSSHHLSRLYTNIPNDEAISQYLFRHRDSSLNPTNHSICKLLELVRKINNFEFDNKEFLQIGGTAMGTEMAPSFTNLFMGYFEEKYVAPYPKQPFLWKQFICHNSVHDTVRLTKIYQINSLGLQPKQPFNMKHTYPLTPVTVQMYVDAALELITWAKQLPGRQVPIFFLFF